MVPTIEGVGQLPPKTLYYVKSRGGRVRTYEKGGGLYSQLSWALGRVIELRRSGATVTLLSTSTLWTEVDDTQFICEHGLKEAHPVYDDGYQYECTGPSGKE